jgi:hypothetical protein
VVAAAFGMVFAFLILGGLSLNVAKQKTCAKWFAAVTQMVKPGLVAIV